MGSSTVYHGCNSRLQKSLVNIKFKTPVIESTSLVVEKLFCAGVGANHPDITNASRAIKPKEKTLMKKILELLKL